MEPRLEMMALGKIKGADRNPKDHDIDGIKASIRRFGFRDFPTINEASGKMVEGHGRIIALKSLKREGPIDGEVWPPDNVAERGRSWFVPVIRGQQWRTDGEAEAYLLAHNQLTMGEGWIEKELALLLRDINTMPSGLDGLGFDDDYVEGLLRDYAEGRSPEPVFERPDIVEPPIPDLPSKAITKDGDMWILGENRLRCGDCRDALIAASPRGFKIGAMVTDPPYGLNIDGVHNDDPEQLGALFRACLAAAPLHDAVVIAFQSPRLFPVWLNALAEARHKFERALWWYETGGHQFPWRGWYMHGEILLVSTLGSPSWPDNFPFFADTYHHQFGQGRDDPSLFKGIGEEAIHPTVKPTWIVADLVQHTTGDVYEPFAGSGSTVMACEQLGRRCLAIEIDRAYCDVIVERWQALTGKQAIRRS